MFRNLIHPLKWICPICWHPTDEPSRLTSRAWCRMCEEYLYPTTVDKLPDIKEFNGFT